MTQAETIAAEFVKGMRRALTPDQFAEMRRRNAAQTHPAVCHSHDFIDANLVMDSAFKAVTGHSIGEREEAGNGGMTDAELELWSEAWNIAKAGDLTDAPKWGVAEKELLVALNPQRTAPFYFVTLFGEIPSSPKRYKTRDGAERAAERRNRAESGK